ncbi:Relaxin receptor 2 [Amphibalanus amphitrite]|uniref:Relaxin receptor 2 n=1 Tax=Amphibalanus amphitrite TaxID=1232801 RepID=A0A6A4X6M7_AMPAM|nr:Relaxin receptor 2 [Amphibalanus amphitrite]
MDVEFISTFPGVCPKGTKYVCELRSGEARYCLQEVFICDGVRHCKNGEDEGVDLCKLENYNQPVCNCVYNTRLECDDRQLTRIPGNVSPNVTRMYLHRNRIVLHKGDLDKYKKLTMILLRRNRLTRLPEMAFSGAGSSLTQLLMDQNLLTHMPPIGHLTQLHFLYLSGNRLTLLHRSWFVTTGRLTVLRFARFSDCAYTPRVKNCEPRTDGVSSMEHLLDTTVHKAMIWLIALMTVTGNLVVLWGRGFQRADDNKNVSVLICNLAVADLLMGIYLFVLAFKDLEYRGDYNEHAAHWRDSPLCVISGVLAMTSSEQAQRDRLPQIEPSVFRGDHTTFHMWLKAFEAYIEARCSSPSERLHYLGHYTAGDARNSILGFLQLSSEDAYMQAKKRLTDRYGNAFITANEFKKRLYKWPEVKVAVMIMTFMSVDRFLAIVYPMIRQRASNHMSRTVLGFMSVIWTVGLIIALVPVFYWRSYSTFYGINGICFPLHVQRPDFVGWKYSAFIFLGINVFSLILIIGSYAAMFFNIQQTRRNTPLVVREVEVALRFFCIVATDCLCWTPIVVTKVLVLIGVQIPTELHAWIVVFVLPINSAVNPFLYTFTTTKFYSRIKTVTTKYSSCMPKGPRRESVNNTGSESVAFTQRHSLQVLPPTASEHHGPSPTPGDPLLVANNVADSKC